MALRDLENGQVKFAQNNYRIDIRHSIYNGLNFDRNLRRIIGTVRNPVELIDSKYRLHFYTRHSFFINGTQGYFKLKKGYQQEPIYKEFIRYYLELEWFNMPDLLKEAKPVIFVTYNDFITKPLDSLCEMLSFIDRVSCNVSYALPAIKKFVEKNELSTSYRVGVSFISKEEDRNKTLGLMEEFGQDGVKIIWNDNEWRNFIRVFGMASPFCVFLNLKCSDEELSEFPHYRTHNARVIAKLTKYSGDIVGYRQLNEKIKGELLKNFLWRNYSIDNCDFLMFNRVIEMSKYIEDFSIFDYPAIAMGFFDETTQYPHPCFGPKHKRMEIIYRGK